MRAPEDATPAPQLGAASRLKRVFVAVIVVSASAMTGDAGSHLWPLPTLSAPMMHLLDKGNAEATPVSATPELNGVRPAGSDTSTPRVSMVSDPPGLTPQPPSKAERRAAARRWAPSATGSRV